MANYELKVDGKTYYFVNEAEYNEVKDAGSTEEQKELIAQYGKTKVSTNEDDLVEIDETGETEGTDGNNPTDEVSFEGYDDAEFEAFCSTVGLSGLSEDSSVDDLKTIYQNIEKEISGIERKIKGIDMDDPASIDDVMTDMITIYAGLEALGEGLGLDINTGGGQGAVAGVAVGVGVGLAGVKIGAIIGTTVGPVGTIIGAAIGGLIGGLIGFFTGDKSKELEQLKEDVQKSLESFTQKFTDIQTKFVEYTEEELVPEIEDELEGLLDGEFKFDDINDTRNITENLDNIIKCQQKIEPYVQLADKFGISSPKLNELAEKLGTGDDALQYAQDYVDSYADAVDISLTDDVVEDTGKLNEIYSSVSSIITEAQSRGLKTDKLEKLLKTTTETNQEAADNEANDITNGAGSGSGTSGLQPYTITQPSSGGGISTGGGSSGLSGGSTGGSQGANTSVVEGTESAIEGSNTAEETSQGVESNSSSYETSTDKLDEASKDLKESAQAQVDAYLESIKASGSITELESMYNQVSATYEELKGLSGEVDLSGFETKLNEIRSAQQKIVDEYTSQVSGAINSSSSSSERKELLAGIEATMSQYAEINIDFSGLSALVSQIKDKEQQYIDEQTQAANNTIQNAATKEEITNVINNITVIINESNGLGADVSGLTAAVEQLNAKLEEIIAKETAPEGTGETEDGKGAGGADFETRIQNILTAINGAKSLESLSALKGEVDLLMNEAVANSYPTEEIENLYLMLQTKGNELSGEVATDGEETVNKTTNVEILNNVAINVNNNIVHVININADTKRLEDLLQKIYDKISELAINPPEEKPDEDDTSVEEPKEECPPEDELPVEDNPNDDPNSSGIIDPTLGIEGAPEDNDNIEDSETQTPATEPDNNDKNDNKPEETIPEGETTPSNDNVTEDEPKEDNTKVEEPKEDETAVEPPKEDNTAATPPVNKDNETYTPSENNTTDSSVTEDDTTPETPQTPVSDNKNDDTATEDDMPCETEDNLPETDMGGSSVSVNESNESETQADTNQTNVYEGEDGHDIELDFEEDEK